MASTLTHLAIAKLYLERQDDKIVDRDAFYLGSFIADYPTESTRGWTQKGFPRGLYRSIDESHYGTRAERVDLVKRHKEKIGLAKFLASNKLDNDLNRGKFLHLYTDWVYYNELLKKDYLQNLNQPQLWKDNTRTWNHYDAYLLGKYGNLFDLAPYGKYLQKTHEMWRKNESANGNLQYTLEEFEPFIDRMASADIDKLVLVVGFEPTLGGF